MSREYPGWEANLTIKDDKLQWAATCDDYPGAVIYGTDSAVLMDAICEFIDEQPQQEGE